MDWSGNKAYMYCHDGTFLIAVHTNKKAYIGNGSLNTPMMLTTPITINHEN